MKNTYRTTTRYNKNGEVTFQEQFSKGESLTEADLDLIARRSKRTYETDAAYESYLSEDYTSMIYVDNNIDNLEDRVQIGNNLPGAE